MVDITVLGPLTVAGSGHLSPRDRVVLAALAVRAGQPVSTDRLADALWHDTPPASAAKVVQGCVVRLRKVLGSDAIETLAHGYRLAVPADDVDAHRFEGLVARSRELLTLGEADRAAYLATQALALWRGPAFSELEEWAPATHEARRLDELRLEAEELRVESLLRVGRHREVLAEAEAMVRAASLRERRWVLLAHAQYQAGNQGEALRTLHQLKTVLGTRLGVEPGPDATAMEVAILQQDPSLMTRAMVTAGATCPYQGLHPFDIEDADRYFGRETDVDACMDVLRRTPLLALVGPSGSGKSSLLRAGVATRLRARGTPSVLVVPGTRPLEALGAVTGGPDGTALLVDQFEEVFSLCSDPAEQREFLRLLLLECRRRCVVIALRADHLADLSSHPDVARLVERGLHLVGALSAEGLAQAIEGPARQVGLRVEHGLVELLVHEVEDDAGALPLLSHVLLETWRRREGNTLTVAGYRASGGIHGAVAQSAERLYAHVEVQHRQTLRDLVLRLVTPGPRGEPVRIRVPRRMVATDPERERLVEMLVAARLVTSDDGVVEITHEALTRAWPRLRGWLDDDVEGQRMLHHLSSAADTWDSMGRPDSELYRGVRLARIVDWQGRSSSSLTGVEHDFLAASRELADTEERSAEERARSQARLIRRLRVVLTGAVVLLVLALAAGGVAAVQSDNAADNAAQARAAQAAADAQALTAQVGRAGLGSAATTDVDQSVLLALAGYRLQESPEAMGALTEALSRNPALFKSTRQVAEEALAIDLSPDGRRIVTLDAQHRVRLLDEASGGVVAERQAGVARDEIDELRSVQFSPDGRSLAVGRTPFSPDPVALFDGETLRPGVRLAGLPRGPWRTADVAFSQDGRTLAAALQRMRTRDGVREVASTWAAVWRLQRPTDPTLVDLRQGDADWAALALSPQGDRLYALPSGRVHDLSPGGGERAFWRVDLERASGLATSPDGGLLAFGTGTGDGAVVLDARSGRVVHRLAPGVTVSDVRFSADGRRLLTTHWGTRRVTAVWDVRSGRPVDDLLLTNGTAQAVDLNATGDTVVSADVRGAVRRWDVTGARRYLRRIPLRGFPPGWMGAGGSCFATPASGGAYVAYVVCAPASRRLESSYLLLDVARRRARLVPHAFPGWNFGGGSWRPDRGTFLRADGGFLREYDGRNGRLLRAPHPLGDRVADVDHSPDGSVVAAAEASGLITLLDADSLRPIGTPVDLGEAAAGVSAGPDNRTAFVMTVTPSLSDYWDATARSWAVVDLEEGTVLARGELGFDGNWPAYSPDGDHAAITGFSGEVLIVDRRTGAPVRPAVRAHAAGVYWAAFSPDGTRLVTAADDGTVVLWETRTARQLGRVTLPTPGLVSAEFRPDGTLLIVPWGPEAAVYVWDPSPERAAAFACRVVGREITEQEWRDHFGDRPYRAVCPP